MLKEQLDGPAAVAAYKSLAHVERAFRSIKTVDLIRSEQAKAKDASKLADDGLPLHSSRTLLKDLGTLTYNIIAHSRPTPIQDKAFKLLALTPNCSQ